MGSVDDRGAVTALVSEWIGTQRATGRTWDAIAQQLRVSKPTVIAISDGSRSVGQDVEAKVATALYDGSIDALRRAARERAAETAAKPAGPPNLREAIDLLRARRELPDEVVAVVLRTAEVAGDLDTDTWMFLILDKLRRFGAK